MAQPSVGDDAFQDFLLDMDFDELIPVDNFFNTYVGTLSEKQDTFGARLPSVEVQDISQVYANGARAPQQPQMHPGMAMPQQQHMPGNPGTIPLWQEHVPGGVPPGASPSHIPSGELQNGNQMHNGAQMPPSMSAHVPPAPAPLDIAPPPLVTQPQPPMQPANGAQALPDEPHSPDNGSRSSGHRPNRRQTKTERQQMLNKAAQQRYRERKKAKAMELKQAVACLQDKVDELSVVQAEKVNLEDRVDKLEKELALKEAQLVAMHKQAPPAGGAGRGGGGEEPSTESLNDFVCQFKDEVANLQAWLERRGYAQCGMLRVEELPVADVDALRSVTERCYAACLRCLSMYADVDIVSLMDSTLDRSQMRFHGGPDMWNNLVQRLQLKPAAVEHALQLRSKYMARLDELFHERQSLNLQAIKVLLPQEMGGLSMTGKSDSGPTFQERCKHAYETGAALRRLRANLGAEQKALAELDYLVYIKLLDPVQLSKCILAAFPEHCDVVSLLNAVHAAANPQA
eukprot:jgi/Ulvmu1/12260/UM086_0053.1